VTFEQLDLHLILSTNCLFINDFLLLFFYVNDIIILFNKRYTQKVKEFKASLLRRFEMRTLKELKWFLEI
jgi:hypothetical protein